MDENSVKIEASWKKILKDEFQKPYFKALSVFVRDEYQKKNSDKKIFPAPKDIFRSFDLCPFHKVKVVILGQDPYHGEYQANGLSFSVNNGITLPPSLKNIFKEIKSDIGIEQSEKSNGDLSDWAKQGVLLLNATLTVRAQSPGSHQNRGWEQFTDAVIDRLVAHREHIVFMLWGNYAKNKGRLIDRTKNLVLESAHPSPFSAYNGFFGCKHFSKTNRYLRENEEREIEWS